MKEVQCLECGAVFDIDDNADEFFCIKCGAKQSVQSCDNTNQEAEAEERNEQESGVSETVDNIDSGKKKSKILYICTAVISAVVLICLFAFANNGGLSDRKWQKILADNGYYGTSDATVERIEDISLNNSGVSENNKFILSHCNGRYAFCVLNMDTKEITDIAFQFTPLNVVQNEIWQMGKDINIKDYDIAKKYIEKYGVNYFTLKVNCEKYLREITGKSGIISTTTAQNYIRNSTALIFPDVNSSDDVTVLFEKQSAVPMYYIAKSTKQVYNWGSPPESVYPVWKASTDRRTQEIMQALYGPPYVMKTVWAAVDSDLKEVGTFSSLESAIKKLAGSTNSASTVSNSKIPAASAKNTENTVSKNAPVKNQETTEKATASAGNTPKPQTEKPKTKTTIVYKITYPKEDTDFYEEVKEYLKQRLDKSRYRGADIAGNNLDELEVTIPYQENLGEVYSAIHNSPYLTLKDYLGNVILKENDVTGVKLINDDSHSGYPYLIRISLTDEGRQNLKSSIEKTFELPDGNNYTAVYLEDLELVKVFSNELMTSDSLNIRNDGSLEANRFMSAGIKLSLPQYSFEYDRRYDN